MFEGIFFFVRDATHPVPLAVSCMIFSRVHQTNSVCDDHEVILIGWRNTSTTGITFHVYEAAALFLDRSILRGFAIQKWGFVHHFVDVGF